MIDSTKIISQLEQLDSRLVTAIQRVVGNNPTRVQILEFLTSDQFDKLIDDLGLRKIIGDYASGFDLSFSEQVSGFGKIDLTAQQIQRITQNVDLIKNTYGRTIVGYFDYIKNDLRVDLINSIVNGETFENTRLIFGDKIIGTPNPAGAFYRGKLHHFSEANVGTVINTAYTDYARTVTSEIFRDKPEQRFEYIGAIIPTSSDECRWLMQAQAPEGYTRKQINQGIETPYKYQYGELIGETKKIFWEGRFPNYNCLHMWEPL